MKTKNDSNSNKAKTTSKVSLRITIDREKNPIDSFINFTKFKLYYEE